MEREAVESVLAADNAAGERRNHASETSPAAVGVAAYVVELEALDLSRCPDGFARAMTRHREAWAAMVPYLADFAHERGELHDVFDRLESEANPTRTRFEELLAAVWSTWAEVEAALAELED